MIYSTFLLFPQLIFHNSETCLKLRPDMSVLGRCPPVAGVRLWQVSACGRCVCLWQVSACGRCPPVAGVRLWQVSACGRCPPVAGVRLWQVSACGRCLPVAGVCLWQVSRLWQVSTCQFYLMLPHPNFFRYLAAFKLNYIIYL